MRINMSDVKIIGTLKSGDEIIINMPTAQFLSSTNIKDYGISDNVCCLNRQDYITDARVIATYNDNNLSQSLATVSFKTKKSPYLNEENVIVPLCNKERKSPYFKEENTKDQNNSTTKIINKKEKNAMKNNFNKEAIMNNAILISILANVVKAKAYIFGETNDSINTSENLDSAIEELMEAEDSIGKLLINSNNFATINNNNDVEYEECACDNCCGTIEEYKQCSTKECEMYENISNNNKVNNKKYAYVVYNALAGFGQDTIIVTTPQKAYETIKKIIDGMPEDDNIEATFKAEAYEELEIKYKNNPELYCITEIADVQKVKLPTT